MKKKDRSGSAIIFNTGILLVLSILAITFVRVMRLERSTAINYTNKTAARFVAFAGIERAMRGLVNYMSSDPYSARDNTLTDPTIGDWAYNPAIGLPLTRAIRDLTAPPAVRLSYERPGPWPYNARFSGAVGVNSGVNIVGSYENFGNTYALKIMDCAGQINVNSHYSPSDQANSNDTLARIIGYLADACWAPAVIIPAQRQQILDTLVLLRGINPVSHKRWQTKEDVIAALRGLGLSTNELNKFLDCITVNSWIDSKTFKVGNIPTLPSTIPNYISEQRAPVNINTAPREVLIAILSDLKARPVLWVTNVARQNDTDGATGGSGGAVFDEHTLVYTPTRINSNQITITNAMATSIADAIIATREAQGAFRHWDDFSRFVDTLVPPSIPADVANTWADNMNPAGGSDVNLGVNIWNQAVHDMIKANFNPNVVDNCFNPNASGYMRTIKADLFDNSDVRTHSTEFCFCSFGRYEITSLGRITALGGQEFGSAILRAEVFLADILRQTSQSDFETRVATHLPNFYGNTTMTLPQITAAPYSSTPDDWTGYVEPCLIPFSDAGAGVLYPLTNEPHPFMATANPRLIPANDSARFAWMVANRGWTVADRSMDSSLVLPYSVRNRNNLLRDGVFSSRTQADSLNSMRYFSIHAITVPPAAGSWRYDPAGMPPYTSRIPYYRGALEFWVKLTEDSDAQIGCGLLSASLVNPSPTYYVDPFGNQLPAARWPFSEGVQFYIFKNTLGELRFSRIYFCLCWDNATTPPQLLGSLLTTDADNFSLGGTMGPGTINDPPNNAGPIRFAYPRRDLLVRSPVLNPPNMNWRPHTWHHVFLRWDDTNGAPTTNLMRVWIDGVDINSPAVQVISRRIAGGAVPPPCNDPTVLEPEYCQLNEYNPRECLNISGFFRPQMQQEGMFKFDTEVNFPANGTISDIKIYNQGMNLPSARSRFVINATYGHRFSVPSSGRLGSLLCTAYPSPIAAGDPLYFTLRAQIVGGPAWPWTSPSAPDAISAIRLQGTNIVAGNELEYQIEFADPADHPSYDPLLRGCLDDVTLIIIRPRIVNITEIENLFL